MATKLVWNPKREKTDAERELKHESAPRYAPPKAAPETPKTRNERLRERWERAYARAAADNLDVVRTSESEFGIGWSVCHPNGGRCYHVHARKLHNPGELTCNCAAGDDPDGICKHRAAVLAHEEERTTKARVRWQGKRAKPAPDPAAVARWAELDRRYPPCAGRGAAAPYVDCACDPTERAVAQRSAVKTHLDEARAQMGYLLHFAELTPTAADSVKRALLALNRAYNAS